MSQFAKIFISLALFCAIAAQAAVNYPYPQRKNYGNSTINTTSCTASDNLKSHFENFVRDFYEEGTCGSTSCARIKFDTPAETVSEGIGYAMIMMVYFSEASPGKSYQTHFDKLWAYYKNFRNGNGVMNWKVNGFNNVTGQNGATDAELDVAIALAMARYQFGNTQYETDAKELIGKIWQHEVESSDGLLKPGDAWAGDRNPSYVSPAAFEIFKGLNTSDWAKVLTRNYTFLKNNQNSSNGLPSGWAQDNGTPKTCSNGCGDGERDILYDQDAVRAPWRWAWSNAWYNHADAKTLLTKLATWVNGKAPGDIKGPIKQSDGTMGTNPNSAYVGSLACALTHSSTYQDRLNQYWTFMNGIGNESYFNQALRLLTGLLITGNMPNLKECPSCGSAMPSCGTDPSTSTQIDKFAKAGSESQEEQGFAATWEPWYAYTDKDSKGASTITNAKFTSKDENDNCKEIESYRVVLEDGGEYVAKISSYTLVKDQNTYAPFVALGLDARKNGTGSGKNYNFAGCTNGFSYSYKGQGHNFKVQTSAVTEEGADHFTAITTASTTAWKSVIITSADLLQPEWAKPNNIAFDASKIYAFAWEIKGNDKGEAGISALTGNLAIKDFKCLGNITLPSSRPPSACGGGGGGSSSSVSSGGGSSSSVSGSGTSSSSRAGSSSSVSGSGTSSSSRAGSSSSRASSVSSSSGGTTPASSSSGNAENSTSSSSGGGNSPIIISKMANANAAQPIKNGISLQVIDNATLEVFNLNGKLFRKLDFSSGVYSIQLQDMPKGLYIVKANFGSRREVLYVPIR